MPGDLVEIEPRPFRVVIDLNATSFDAHHPEELTESQATHLLMAVMRIVDVAGQDAWKILDSLEGR